MLAKLKWLVRRACRGGSSLLALAALLALVLGARPASADPLDNWSWRNPLPQGAALAGLAQGGGVYVAVGAGGTLLSSPDRTTWTIRSPGSGASLTGVCWGNGKFVAVGEAGALISSTDGTSWTRRASGTTDTLTAVTWGNGQFVAVGYGLGTILTSPDGITWTNRTLGVSAGLQSVAWGGTRYVAVGAGGAVYSSPDGVAWTARSSGTTSRLRSVAWNGSVFVAVGDLDYTSYQASALSSPDGVTWTRRSSGATSPLAALVWGGGRFLAAGSGGAVYGSTDGATWTAVAWGLGYAAASLAWDGTRYLCAGSLGGLSSSTDGATWAALSRGQLPYALKSVAYGNGRYVAVGDARTLVGSPDGVTWTVQGSGEPGSYTRVIWGNGLFVAVGDGGSVSTSPDGTTWTARSSKTASRLNAVLWANSGFVAVGQGGTVITSPDGVAWTARFLGTSTELNAVAWDGNQYLAVGGGYFFSSPDAITWQPTAGYDLKSIIWTGRQFLAGGYGAVYTSTDGVAWSHHPVAGAGYLYDLSYQGGLHLAVSDNFGVYSSADGAAWSARTTVVPSATPLYGITLGQGRFTAVGGNGAVIQSDPVTLACSYTLGSGSLSVAGAGASGSIAVSTSPSCLWNPASEASWITLGGNGAGNGTLGYTVAANTGPPRSAGVTVGDQRIVVRQDSWLLTVSGSSAIGGSVACSSPVSYGGASSCLIAAASGYSLSRLTDNGSDVTPQAANGTYTLTNVTRNHAVVASFADLTPPTVNALGVPATSTTLTVAITVQAWDALGVTGYLVSESPATPAAAAAGWSPTAPTSYSFAGQGNKTLYAWAKDAAGNVSAARSATLTVALPVGWNPHAQLQPPANLKGVAWNGTRYVAVGDAGTILSSGDGLSWNAAASGTTANLNGIAWGGGVFVAVGAGGTVLSSPDGSVWTPRSSGTPLALNGVGFGGGQFVAVGAGALLSSPDGATWTTRSTGTPYNLSRVAWGNNLFVAVGGDFYAGGVILTSADAVSWTRRPSGLQQYGITGLVWANQFVAGAADGSVLSSPDGTSWTRRSSGTSYALNDVAWGSGRFVAAGSAGTLLFSFDGITWLAAASRTTAGLNALLWQADRFLIVGDAGVVLHSDSTAGNCASALDALGHAFTSAGGNAATVVTLGTGCAWSVQTPVSWLTLTTPLSGSGPGTVGFQAAANTGAARSAVLTVAGLPFQVSQEVARFSLSAAVTGSGGSVSCPASADYGSDVLCAISPAAGFALTSLVDNGQSVLSQAGSAGYTVTSIAANHTLTAAFQDVQPPQVTSFSVPPVVPTLNVPVSSFTATDNVAVAGYLITESATRPAATDPRWKASAPLEYTVAGTGARTLYAWARDAAGNVSAAVPQPVFTTLLTYAELDDWSAMPTGTSSVLTDIAFGNGRFAVAGTDKTLSSADGSGWTVQTWPTGTDVRGIAFGAGRFVAVGYRSSLSSADGLTWTATGQNPTLPGFRKVAWGPGLFAATTDDGRIMTSPDGITWTYRSTGNRDLLEGIAWGNNLFVAVGPSGATVTSPDGITWTYRPLPSWVSLKSIVWAGDQFVAVGGGVIASSPDGITWTQRMAVDLAYLDLNDVTWGAGVYVAVGAQVYSSPDGINWAKRSTGIVETLNGVAFGNNRFAAVGTSGTVYLTDPLTDNCTYILPVSALSFDQHAGAGEVSVTAGSSCPWAAYSDVPWIAVTGPTGGTGSGSVVFSVAENTSNSRTGTFHVAGQTVAMSQKAGGAQQLSVTVNGSGQGTVTSVPAGIVCLTGTCSAPFDAQAAVSLIATPSSDSDFTGWGGACTNSNGDCSVIMSDPQAVTAGFQPRQMVRIPNTPPVYYSTLAAAYASAADGASLTVDGQAVVFNEDLNLFRQVLITFTGGYDGTFTKNTGYSIVKGNLTIRKGCIKVERLYLR